MTPAEIAALEEEARQNPALAPHIHSLIAMRMRAKAIADMLARKADLGRALEAR